jgi:ribosomal protein L37AE/L43A
MAMILRAHNADATAPPQGINVHYLFWVRNMFFLGGVRPILTLQRRGLKLSVADFGPHPRKVLPSLQAPRVLTRVQKCLELLYACTAMSCPWKPSRTGTDLWYCEKCLVDAAPVAFRRALERKCHREARIAEFGRIGAFIRSVKYRLAARWRRS